MRKMRHEKRIYEGIDKKFTWIKSIRLRGNFIPSSDETYHIELWRGISQAERENFEKFVLDFYEVKKGRAQVILFWRENGLIFVVFRPI